MILGCRSLTKGNKALEELQARKPAGTLSVLELDVTNDDTINAAAQKITSDFGKVDVLVNNAGIVVLQPQGRRSELLDVLNTNSIGPLVLTEALLPLLKKSNGPRIINVSSSLGSITLRSDPNSHGFKIPAEGYRMSKAALNMVSACMYTTYRGWGAKVWSYCPGYVVTNLTGEGNRQRRVDTGAESSETSAEGIVEIVEGKRDKEIGLFIQRRGQRWDW